MIEYEGVESTLYRIKEKIERKNETRGNPRSDAEKLRRFMEDPGKLPTTEEPASEQETSKLLETAGKIRTWLQDNGRVGSNEKPEQFKDKNVFGAEKGDFEDLANIRWAFVGTVDIDHMLIHTDLDPDLDGFDLVLETGTQDYAVMMRIASDRTFDLCIGFHDWGMESYLITNESFEDMDRDQVEIISFYLDEAERRFEIPVVN